MELEARGAQRRQAVVRPRTPHGETVGAHGLGGRIAARFQLPLQRPHAAHLFLELLLGVAVGFVDRLRGFPQIVEVAELMRHAGQRRPHRAPDGVLPVGDHAADRHGERLLHFLQQPGEAWFDCNMMQKDMLLAMELGRQLNVPVPTTAVSNEFLTAARGMGWEKKDFAVVFDVLARMSGVMQ